MHCGCPQSISTNRPGGRGGGEKGRRCCRLKPSPLKNTCIQYTGFTVGDAVFKVHLGKMYIWRCSANLVTKLAAMVRTRRFRANIRSFHGDPRLRTRLAQKVHHLSCRQGQIFLGEAPQSGLDVTTRSLVMFPQWEPEGTGAAQPWGERHLGPKP